MEKIDIRLVTNILEALESAREAFSLLPPLPADMKPVYFRVLNAIYIIGNDTGGLRVSDISKVSGLLLPNATKVINEMVDLNILGKYTPVSDKRVVMVQTTELGEQYIDKYVFPYFEGLNKELSKINEVDCMIMIETINKVYQAIKTVTKGKETELS
ncbi:MAG: hypothetical protein ACM3NT_11095 [Methylocystaceae bacterium]